MPQSARILHSQARGPSYKVPADHLHKDLSNLIRFLIFSIILSWCRAPVPQISGLSEWCSTNELIQITLKSQIRFKMIQSGWNWGGRNAGPKEKAFISLCCFKIKLRECCQSLDFFFLLCTTLTSIAQLGIINRKEYICMDGINLP